MITDEKDAMRYSIPEVEAEEDFSGAKDFTRAEDWKFGSVNTGNGYPLNLRTEPNRNSAVLMMIPDGTIVSVKIHDIHWYKVKYNGFEGYCKREFIK